MSEASSPQLIEVFFESVDELEKAFEESIKKGGYFVPSEEPAPRTTRVEINFMLPGLQQPLTVPGEVAFQATLEAPMPGMGPGMAIQFQELSDSIIKAFQAAITIARSEGLEAERGAGEQQETSRTEEEAFEEGEGEEWTEDEESEEEEQEQEGKDGEGPARMESAIHVVSRLNQMTTENLFAEIRKLPMHQKVVAAKRGNRSVRNLLLQEGHKKILTHLLNNPQLSAGEVMQIMKISNLSTELIQAIAKNSQWSQNEEIKYLIAVHPKTPLPLALKTLQILTTKNLAKIAKSGFRAQLKSKAVKLLEQRRK